MAYAKSNHYFHKINNIYELYKTMGFNFSLSLAFTKYGLYKSLTPGSK